MNSIKSRVALTARKATVAASLLGAVATLAVAAPAQAKPAGGSNVPQGCPVEDENGHVTYVPPGTVISILHCGSDGQWHFGWLTTD
jgi:hypothetical protein